MTQTTSTTNEASETQELKHLSGLDAIFLHAETPTTPMNVVAAIVLDTTGTDVGYETILGRFAERPGWTPSGVASSPPRWDTTSPSGWSPSPST